MNGFFGGSMFGGMLGGGFGSLIKPKPGGIMGSGMPMQGPMQPSYFPQAPKPPMFGGMSGGDMMGLASQAFTGGQQSQTAAPVPPPSFYQSKTKAPPRLSGLQYDQPRPMSRLNTLFGEM